MAPINAEITVLQWLRGDRLGRERERVVQEVMRVHADGVTLVLRAVKSHGSPMKDTLHGSIILADG